MNTFAHTIAISTHWNPSRMLSGADFSWLA
nr:MAG TPA: hypothetical protein [Bacteriophage sp.]DAP98607.1 MAG TPA: hypothetical protein [Caudoviricetes sp.]